MTSTDNSKFEFILRYLVELQPQHTLRAIWAVNVPWANPDPCVGLGALCRSVIGSTQSIGDLQRWKDALLGLTYAEFAARDPAMPQNPGSAQDPAIQLSVFLQVLVVYTLNTVPDPHVLGFRQCIGHV